VEATCLRNAVLERLKNLHENILGRVRRRLSQFAPDRKDPHARSQVLNAAEGGYRNAAHLWQARQR